MICIRDLVRLVFLALLLSAAPMQVNGKGDKKKKDKKKVVPPKPKPRSILATQEQLKDKTYNKLKNNKRLNRREKKELEKAEQQAYKNMVQQGFNQFGKTKEATMMRDYKLRKKKRKGLLRKKPASLAQVLFPGVSPEEFVEFEQIWMYTDLVESKKTQVPFEVYDLPGFTEKPENKAKQAKRLKRNLGARLQGFKLKPAPFDLFVKQDMSCKAFSRATIQGKKMRWVRKLIERQYRVHFQLDGLPVLMKSKDLNFAVRGYPVGFKSPSGNKKEFFLYNHFKFMITYHEDEETGIRITGFDVHPVSIKHEVAKNGDVPTCTGFGVENDPANYVALDTGSGEAVPVVFSYDVQWVSSDLEWADRWDVYLVGSPDDDIHYYSIVNSLIIVLFMTGAIAIIMIRTLRKDIAGYNEMTELQALEEGEEETGWKLVHGDVFRPPSSSPMLLSVLVGTGAQIACAVTLAILLSVMKVTSSMKKGQILTSLIMLYVLCGSVAGYVSARIYKFCEAKAWKMNTIITATALPAVCVIIFSMLNIFLSFAGAATAVSFWMILVLFLLWVCVSAPLVFVGSFIGLRVPTIEVSVKTKQIARVIPDTPGAINPIVMTLLGGALPFGAVCIELAFIMSALWLHQIYYVMGFLLAVIFVLVTTCAQVSIVMCYVQLCNEDHRWWWKAFWNCATAGVYLFLYSLWFLKNRLNLIGLLPVIVYMTYMTMICVFFGLFCGASGFLSAFWFNRTIYGAVKVD